jgi:hypothetical protein
LQWLPPVPNGCFAAQLSQGLATARGWHERLRADARWQVGPAPALDIVTWLPAEDSVRVVSERAQAVQAAAASLGLHLGLAQLPARWFGRTEAQATVLALRAVWMKPMSESAMAGWWAVLEEAWRRTDRSC